MLSTTKLGLKSIIDSVAGIHLSIYIKNHQDSTITVNHIQNALSIAYHYLAPILPQADIDRFLQPIKALTNNEPLLKSFKGNFAIFKNASTFRIINLPIAIENSCFVADSFHIKPLLKWLQVDRKFLFLGVNYNQINLYQGSLSSFNLVDSFVINSSSISKAKLAQIRDWLGEWLDYYAQDTMPKLFYAGSSPMVQSIFGNNTNHHFSLLPIAKKFNAKKTESLLQFIRSTIMESAHQEFKKSMYDFYYLNNTNKVNKNVYNIAKAAVRGKVKKLMIAEEINLFGKLNRSNGDLTIHHNDLDHEDDDVLDDLAQTVLAHGGEVLVVPCKEIPNKVPVLAIVKEPDLQKFSTLAYLTNQLNNLQKRSSL